MRSVINTVPCSSWMRFRPALGGPENFFSYMHYGMEPDIVTLAKSLGGGVPIGAILAKEHVAQAFKKATTAPPSAATRLPVPRGSRSWRN